MKTKVGIKKKKKVVSKKVVIKKEPEFVFDPMALDDPTDPRRSVFASYYLNPQSPHFSNGLRSAIAAGFTESYARNIIANKPEWLCDIVARLQNQSLIETARNNLVMFANLATKEQVVSMFGPVVDKDTGEPVMKENAKLLKIKQDTTHLIVERLVPEFQKKEKDDMGGNTLNVQFNYYSPQDSHETPKKEAEVVTESPVEDIDALELIKEIHDSNTPTV